MKNTFKIKDSFWSFYQEMVSNIMLPYQYEVLNDSLDDPDIEKSHSIENFRIAAGESAGEFYGQVFQDSDTAKWLEAVAYSLMIKPDINLEKKADEIIDLIGRAQEKDGYLNTYFTVKRPTEKWRNLQEGHELYCSGHMIEAGVAYYEATGKTKLLDIVKKNADLIYDIFITNKRDGIPGHPEIELALLRLYNITGDKKYLELSEHFIDERGKKPNFFEAEAKKLDWTVWNMDPKNTDYLQNTNPVREEINALGHAVRAVYLYTGMAMAAKETGDVSLIKACEKMWESIVNKRMYITGGIGSTAAGEAFTMDYDLPNDTAYNETCASIGLIFFAKAMLNLKNNSKYADIMELALYNTVLAGIQRDGTRFLYTNPTEVDPFYAGRLPELKHVYAKRPKWHACACCPPNVARLLTSLNRYAWHKDENTLYSDLFISGEYSEDDINIEIKTKYPYDGEVKYTVNGKKNMTLAVRNPNWSKNTKIKVNGEEYNYSGDSGYIKINGLSNGDEIILSLDITPHKIYANPRVKANIDKCALMAGPIVYCFEDEDNGNNVNTLKLCSDSILKLNSLSNEFLGNIKTITADGYFTKCTSELYSFEKPYLVKTKLTAIPYYLWGNRKCGSMKVWIGEV